MYGVKFQFLILSVTVNSFLHAIEKSSLLFQRFQLTCNKIKYFLKGFIIMKVSTIVLSTLLSIPTLHAMDINIVPSLGLGQANAKFYFENDPVKSDHSYIFADIGLNVQFDKRYYISFSTTQPITKDEYNVNYIHSDLLKVDVDYDYKRQEYLLILGHRLNNYVNVFTGYRLATSTNDSVINEDKQGVVSHYNNNTEDIKEDGLFLGSSFTYPVKTWGLFGIKAAVALMRANYEVQSKFLYPDKQGNSVDYKGDAMGLSYGIGWYGKITTNLLYSLTLDGYQFSYALSENDKDEFKIDDMKSEYLSYKASVAYRF